MERRPANDRSRDHKNPDHKQLDARDDLKSGQNRHMHSNRPTPEDPEAFRKHMEERLKKSGKDVKRKP